MTSKNSRDWVSDIFDVRKGRKLKGITEKKFFFWFLICVYFSIFFCFLTVSFHHSSLPVEDSRSTVENSQFENSFYQRTPLYVFKMNPGRLILDIFSTISKTSARVSSGFQTRENI